MDKTRIVQATAVLLALALLFLFTSGFFRGTGFFSLPERQETDSPQEKEEANPTGQLGAQLSYEVIKPTTIEATLENAVLKECPKETETKITITNTGPSKAEKVFLEFGQGIKVIGCTNCKLDYLNAGKEAIAKAILCLETSNGKAVAIGSANSNTVEMGFQE